MRILILGAGGTGGYFGGRLAQSGCDVTFLVREARARQLREHGLQIRSPLGDADLQVEQVLAAGLPDLVARQPFDLVVLSCKAYDLDTSLEAIAPAMGAGTAVLPILNGLRHYHPLDQRFGATNVIGGLCFISATKGPDGEVLHLAPPASITFGERGTSGDRAAAEHSERTRALAAMFEQAGVDHVLSTNIAREQWTKYSFLTALAAGTCLMRAPVGAIVATASGEAFMRALYAECLAVADAAGQRVADVERTRALGVLTASGSPIKASMLRDLEAGQPVEAAHIVGDMLDRAEAADLDAPLLAAAWCHLQAYESSRPTPTGWRGLGGCA